MNRAILLLAAATAVTPAVAVAGGMKLSHVPQAMPKAEGMVMPSELSPELIQIPIAQGFMAVENPTKLVTHFGFAGDGPMVPRANSVQANDNDVEATKTEPDKNTYLVLEGQNGPDANYHYGTHFLFQGHEGGPKADDGRTQGALTRINLDGDVAHRVTLMADRTIDGDLLPLIDGRLGIPLPTVFSSRARRGPKEACGRRPSIFRPGSRISRASSEGAAMRASRSIRRARSGSSKMRAAKSERRRNTQNSRTASSTVSSPRDKTDLTKGGRLEALAIMDRSGQPIVFHAGRMDDDIRSQGMRDIHTYGAKLRTKWVLVHDTEKDGRAPFDANKAAKEAGATPLKRPENGLFRPGANFAEFVFDETGDTNADTEAGEEYGGFGAVLKLTQSSPGAAEGELMLVYRGERAHTGFDNCAFWSDDEILFVEDAGDGLHSKRNALDSGYVIDLTADYSNAETEPVRFLAQGRDALATIDLGLSALKDTGFQNDGDNEITGVHVSDGDPSPEGLLGAKIPVPFENGWRVFYTQQHGENTTWEIVKKTSAMKTAAQ